MQINKEIQFEENVMLLDATYLDGLVGQLSVALGERLGRKLPPAELSVWLECMALDGGLRPGDDLCIQVLLIYDQHAPRLQHLQPADLKSDLNDKAFRSTLGEFVVNSYPSSEFASRTDFFVEALKLVADSKEVRRILAVPDAACMADAKDTLEKAAKAQTPKEGKLFGLSPVDSPMYETLAFSLLQALGVKSEEI
jgi:hypothetical protein